MNQTLRDQLVDLSDEVHGADLHERVLRGSRRITMRNRAIGSLATVVVLVGAILAFNAVRPGNQVQPPITSPTPSATPTSPPTPSPSPSVSPTASAWDQLRNATLDVPAFPDTPQCGQGQRKFTNGVAPVSQNINLWINSSVAPAPVMANVDGAPGDELIVPLICAFDSWSQEEVLVFRVLGEGQYSPLGHLSNTSHISVVLGEPLEVVDGTVYLELTMNCNEACPNSDQQRRGYKWQQGSFKQVSGPTQFAVIPPIKDIDYRNTTLTLYGIPFNGKAWSGSVRAVNGTGKAHFGYADGLDGPRTYAEFTVTVGAISFAPSGGDLAFVQITLETGGSRFVVLMGLSKLPNWPGPARGGVIVATGTDGVTAIKAVEPGTQQVKVTVGTAGGDQVRTYSNAMGEWKRVS